MTDDVCDEFYWKHLAQWDLQLVENWRKKFTEEQALLGVTVEPSAFPSISYDETILPPLLQNQVTMKQVNLVIKQLSKDRQGVANTIVGEDFSELAEIMTNVNENDSDLKKLLMKEGTGPCPDKNHLVIVHFIISVEGRWRDISQSTYATRIPHRFRLGMGETHKILDEGVATMCKGEISKFLGTTRYRVSNDLIVASRGEVVRDDARMLIQIELVDVQSSIYRPRICDMSDKRKRELDFETLYPFCASLKLEGKLAIKKGNYEEAAKKYLNAMECASFAKPMTSTQMAKIVKLNRFVIANMASISFDLSKFRTSRMYGEAIKDCRMSVSIQTAGHYWCSKSLLAMNLVDRAYKHIIVARRLVNGKEVDKFRDKLLIISDVGKTGTCMSTFLYLAE
ncbi:unnamed protein product [Orchesella dallaii]|uniref:peptidylprolyl isomerase n=1 Tax=Orchesella dallaii TaxID=48710 RepID=A0ABP1RKN6_9HEXA